MSNPSQVVIVGGGIYGTSLAYELAKAKITVTMLEAGEIAGGASGGPGERGVRCNGRDARELPICALAQELWSHYEGSIDGGVGFRKVGGLKLFDLPYGHREHEVRGRMEVMAATQSSLGAPSQILTRAEVMDREPEVTSSIIGALWCPNDGVGDHTFATRQFAREATRHGAVLRTSAKVVEILHSKGAATGVKLESGEVVAVGDKLVIVSNAGAQSLLQSLFKPHEFSPVWNLMPQMIYVSNPLKKKVNHLISHAHRRLAVKQLQDGTLMLSGGAHVAHTPEGLWKGSLSALTQNVTDAIMTFPFIDYSSFEKVDASRTETVTADAVPLVGALESLPNTIYAYGWSGHGYAPSLGFTKLFRDWILDGRKPEALDVFSPTRFHKPATLLAASRHNRAA